MNPREKAEARERAVLCSSAAFSSANQGREREDSPCPVRTAFQQDCHRIVHSKAFRRLRGKTQVFLWPEGDHYRTRLTHCQEVSQIARTIARALDVNEDLAESIALGHDLGHTPFGHAGEAAMRGLVPGGFRHERQSLRVVESLENNGRGLNLTKEVRNGILLHSKGAGPLLNVSAERLPSTVEGQIVRVADVIAYVNHDLDDALRGHIISASDIPEDVRLGLGSNHSERITSLVLDVIDATNLSMNPRVKMTQEQDERLDALRRFLYEKVYFNSKVQAEFDKARGLLERLWAYFHEKSDEFYSEHWIGKESSDLDCDVKDFLAGMTDAFAVNLHDRLFSPRRWFVL